MFDLYKSKSVCTIHYDFTSISQIRQHFKLNIVPHDKCCWCACADINEGGGPVLDWSQFASVVFIVPALDNVYCTSKPTAEESVNILLYNMGERW